ncbi:MAG: hypothetical protein CMJ51_04255 [Planctomycetaceae bacterium]|nr:hypothetical protein [Planctomycetaceae bacterium]
MTTMHHRPRFIASLLAISSVAFVTGCEEQSVNEDPLASISADYAEVLRSRPVIREDVETPDESSQMLRSLAGGLRSAGAEVNEHASAILATRIYLSSATFDFDEALRMESKAGRLRSMARMMAADADLLANAAANAEALDISSANLAIEAGLSAARERLARAESELEVMQAQVDKAEDQRAMKLAEAAEYERYAIQFQEEGADKGPRAGLDEINESIFNRQEANSRRIAAAQDDISILTVSPTMALIGAEREGQLAVADGAREARRVAEARLEESRSYANDVRRTLETIGENVNLLLRESVELETTQILPRLEAAIGDYETVASTARALTRGGSRDDAEAGWLTISNAQFNAGRCQWEMASVLERRADVLGRLAAGGVLVDPAGVRQDLESAAAARDEGLAAAEASFNQALESLANIKGGDADTARIQQAIDGSISLLKGIPSSAEMLETAGKSSSSPGMSSTAASGGSGNGFGTPAQLAAFMSDPNSQMDPEAFKRFQSAIVATTSSGKSIQSLLTAGSVMLPLFEALSAKFGSAAVMSEMKSSGAMANTPLPTFKVDSVDGDTARLISSDGSQKLLAVKTADGWKIDLDETVANDPQAAMMAEMMGPMIQQMLQPLSKAVNDLATKVRDGTYANVQEAMAALEQAMGQAMPSGLGGGGGGRGGGGFNR